MANGNLEEEGGFIQRVKESPRTVSALIIILIVAAAIYAFSGEETGQRVAQQGNEETAVTKDEAVVPGSRASGSGSRRGG
jgi:hypothetical protein